MSWGKGVKLEAPLCDVAICGIGESDYSGASGRNSKQIAAQAIERAIQDAGLKPTEIDGLMYQSEGMKDQFTVADFHAHFGTNHPIWECDEGGGIIWAATAPHQASEALKSKKAKYIVNSFAVDWATRREEMNGGPGGWHAQQIMKAQFEMPMGWFPQPIYLATFANRHMHQYGTTHEQLGELVTTTRFHANNHPDAFMRERKLDLEQYLAKPFLADPLRKEDCCLISDGGAAYIMTTAERARDMQHRPALVKGIGLGQINQAPYTSQQGDLTSTPQHFSAPGAFQMAGLTPADIDVVGVYDCFSITALMQIEDMGFCQKGEGGEFIANGKLRYDNPIRKGGLPTNTHGGLLSHAYTLGISHVVELVKQIRGTAPNQVESVNNAIYAGYTADRASTLILQGD